MTVRIGRKIIAGNGAASIATTENVGVVKPDGETILIDEQGVISSVGGQVDTSNLVDVDTDQTINSTKTIANQKSLNLESGNSIYTGKLYGGTGNAGNVILECANDSGASPEQLIIGEQGTGTAYYRRGIFLSVPTDEAIYLGQVNSACKIESVNDLKLYGGYKQNSYLHLSNDELKYTKADGSSIDLLSNELPDMSEYYTKSEVDAKVDPIDIELNAIDDELSGINISISEMSEASTQTQSKVTTLESKVSSLESQLSGVATLLSQILGA